MNAALARLEQPAYALLRIVSGALFAVHGMQKLFNVPPSPHAVAQFSQVWFGGVIELVCGVLIAIGLLTRPAAFLASGTMAVAYIQFHWKGAVENLAWLPSVNQGELAVVYCFLFLFIAGRGGGLLSADGRR